jgi:hypothetical protein
MAITTQEVVDVFDLQQGVMVASIPLTDLSQGSGSIALDPLSHKLFACGYSATSMTEATGVDTIDTTTNQVTGIQQVFDPTTDGYYVDCVGGPGYAALVTNGTYTSPAIVHELEPGDSFLPDGFIPYVIVPVAAGAGIQLFLSLGSDLTSGTLQLLMFTVTSETSFQETQFWDLSGFGTDLPTSVAADPVSSRVFYTLLQPNGSGGDDPVPAVEEIDLPPSPDCYSDCSPEGLIQCQDSTTLLTCTLGSNGCTTFVPTLCPGNCISDECVPAGLCTDDCMPSNYPNCSNEWSLFECLQGSDGCYRLSETMCPEHQQCLVNQCGPCMNSGVATDNSCAGCGCGCAVQGTTEDDSVYVCY